MRRPLRRAVAPLPLLPVVLLTAAACTAADDQDADDTGRDLPTTYTLSGDPGGSAFEGIDVTPDGRTFYVSETSGGEIHRGQVDRAETEVWLDEDAATTADRRIAVGIATDGDRVYAAGGDNRTQVGTADAPDFWVYDSDRNLLAALRMPVEGDVFMNDVVVGPDGAAYVTDSRGTRIFRIAREGGNWTATLWAEPGVEPNGPIPAAEGNTLNGIEVSPDERSLVVAQSNVGALWRFDLETAGPTRIETGDVVLMSADGLVVSDRTLVAVRNFPHVLTYLRLDQGATSAELLDEVGTDPERVFTTGHVSDDRLLLVDSQFDERQAGQLSQDSEVVARPLQP